VDHERREKRERKRKKNRESVISRLAMYSKYVLRRDLEKSSRSQCKHGIPASFNDIKFGSATYSRWVACVSQ